MEEVATLWGHTDRVWGVAWNGDDLLASCSGDTTVRIWRRAEGAWTCTQTLEAHSRTVRNVEWSRDGSTLACASFDATTSLWYKDPATGEMEELALLEGHENEVKAASFSSTGRLATCSRDKSVWLWGERESGDGGAPAGQTDYEEEACLTGHLQDVKYVAWHPTREVLLSCGYDNTVKVWVEDPAMPDTWFCDQTLNDHGSTVWQAAFNEAGTVAATCSDDGTVNVYGFRDGRLHKRCTVQGAHPRTVYAVHFRPGHDQFATACGDDGVRIFAKGAADEAPAGEEPGYSVAAKKEHAHSTDVNSVRFSPSGDLLASCSDDNTVKIWRVADVC